MTRTYALASAALIGVLMIGAAVAVYLGQARQSASADPFGQCRASNVAGGAGSIVGTFLGVCLISLLKTGLPYIGLQANWQQIITGGILIAAVTIDMARNRK